jgi:broad specificity phosphatase PhoE
MVRHGTTDWVDTHKMHGVTDIPLNEKGVRQAQKAAKSLKSFKVNAVYTSPLSRCRQTAKAISDEQGLEPFDADGLKEMNFGWLEGHQILHYQIQKAGAVKRFFYNLWRQTIQRLTGESENKFKQRVLKSWNQILEENPDGTIVVVAHILVFRTILQNYFGEPDPGDRRRYLISPTGISELLIDDDGKVDLVRLNDTDHLGEGDR